MNITLTDPLVQATANFIQKEKLFSREDRLVLAVSGGVDSIVLTDILHKLGYRFDMNFQLRGAESDRDEAFVRDLARQYGSRIHVRRADAEAHAHLHKQSLQEAARELRYQWFETICRPSAEMERGSVDEMGRNHAAGTKNQHASEGILLTAHHLDDNIETALMHFFQGTGLSGLRGMLPATQRVVRPLLFASRVEIETYAKCRALRWVEDSSNPETKYSRNFIRHEIIPVIERRFQSFRNSMAGQLHRFRDIEAFVQHELSLTRRKLFVQKGDEWHVPVLKLKKTPGVETILYDMLAPRGFHAAQLADVLHLMEAETGRQVFSSTHRIIRNRAWLILLPQAAERPDLLMIQALPQRLSVEHQSLYFDQPESLPTPDALTNPEFHYLDGRDIRLPLMVRRWKKGDYFYPLGMRKKKKLARFFIDEKMSLPQKEQQWVLESEGRILALLGKRIDDRFKITASTKTVIRIHCTSIEKI
jgi:tRNA(Ile)-lysidine synthase